MGTLHIFGCSFSENFKRHHRSTYQEGGLTAQAKYIRDFCNDEPPLGWSEIIAERIGMPICDKSMGGASNQQIFMNFCEQVQKLKKGDLVIIGWSEITRFRWANKKNSWIPIFPGINNQIVEGMSDETRNEILINRTEPQYIQEIQNIQSLIVSFSKSLGFNVFFWSNDSNIFNPSSIDRCLLILDGKSVLEIVDQNGGKDYCCRNRSYYYGWTFR